MFTIDRNIIRLLRLNGRMSNKELAAQVQERAYEIVTHDSLKA